MKEMTADRLNNIMEFDHVIEVHADGSVTDGPEDIHAPELHDEDVSPGWRLLDGYSGQDGYSGPIMHASEFIGGGMARDILAEPGIYVALVSIDLDADRDAGEDDAIGWAVARWEGE